MRSSRPILIWMEFGYARVSTNGQNPERQITSLLEYGIPRKRIYVEKETGSFFSCRSVYLSLRKRLRKGDKLVISSLDRLGRNYLGVLDEWQYLTRVKEAKVVVLDMPLLGAGGEGLGLLGDLLSDLVLRLLSFVAEQEKTNILERQRQGIAAAKSRGVRFGRPCLLIGSREKEALSGYLSGVYSGAEAIAISGMKRSTFYSVARRMRQEWKGEEQKPCIHCLQT